MGLHSENDSSQSMWTKQPVELLFTLAVSENSFDFSIDFDHLGMCYSDIPPAVPLAIGC